MSTLTKDQVKQIILGAPVGVKPEDIVNKLISNGHILQGYGEPVKTSLFDKAASATTIPGSRQLLGAAGGVLGGLSGAVTSPVKNVLRGEFPYSTLPRDIAEGAKSGYDTFSNPAELVKQSTIGLVKPFGEFAAETGITNKIPRLSSPQMVQAKISPLDFVYRPLETAKQIKAGVKDNTIQKERSQVGQDTGATFSDVLNAISFLPGGFLGKTVSGLKAPVGKGLSGALNKGAEAFVHTAPFTSLFGVAGQLDQGVTDWKKLVEAGAFSGVLGGFTAATPAIVPGVAKATAEKTSSFLKQKALDLNEAILGRSERVRFAEKKRGITPASQTILDYGFKGTKEQMLSQSEAKTAEGAKMVQGTLEGSQYANEQHSLSALKKDAIDSLRNAVDDEGAKLNSTEYNKYKAILKNSFDSAMSFFKRDSVSTVELNQIKQDFWQLAKYGEPDFEAKNQAHEIAGEVLRERIQKTAKDVNLELINKELGNLIHTRNQINKSIGRKIGLIKRTALYPLFGAIFGVGSNALGGFIGGKALQMLTDHAINSANSLSSAAKIINDLAGDKSPQARHIVSELNKMFERQFSPQGIGKTLKERPQLPAPKSQPVRMKGQPYTPEPTTQFPVVSAPSPQQVMGRSLEQTKFGTPPPERTLTPMDIKKAAGLYKPPGAYFGTKEQRAKALSGEYPVNVVEGKKISHTPAEFRYAALRTLNTHPGSLTEYSLKDYAKMETKMTADKKTGYAIKDGSELVSVFNNGEKGMGSKAVQHAIENGATHLDAFAGLEAYYKRFGFEEVKRVPWDDKYMPKNWDLTKLGKPDIVYMKLNPKKYADYKQTNPSAAGEFNQNATRGVESNRRRSGGTKQSVRSLKVKPKKERPLTRVTFLLL